MRQLRESFVEESLVRAFFIQRPDGAQLRHLTTLVDQGVLRPRVDRVFPFAQTREALKYAESGKVRGKAVVQRLE